MAGIGSRLAGKDDSGAKIKAVAEQIARDITQKPLDAVRSQLDKSWGNFMNDVGRRMKSLDKYRNASDSKDINSAASAVQASIKRAKAEIVRFASSLDEGNTDYM